MEDLYTIAPSPGEGLGCFSKCPIAAGTRILCEAPLFSVPEPRNNAAVITAFSRLSSSQQDQYLSLHAVDPENRAEALIVDIFNSNAWQTGGRTSICALAARFNHSCIPNACFSWNERLSKVTVHAIIAIPANTQICLSYEKPYQGTASRREKLSAYGFVCSCAACESEPSNIRRDRMTVLDARIRSGRRQLWRSPMPQAALELIRLLKEEGLMGEALGLAYHDAADGWKKYKRLDLAARYAVKELNTCILCFGTDSPYVDITATYLRQLEVAQSQVSSDPRLFVDKQA